MASSKGENVVTSQQSRHTSGRGHTRSRKSVCEGGARVAVETPSTCVTPPERRERKIHVVGVLHTWDGHHAPQNVERYLALRRDLRVPLLSNALELREQTSPAHSGDPSECAGEVCSRNSKALKSSGARKFALELNNRRRTACATRRTCHMYMCCV